MISVQKERGKKNDIYARYDNYYSVVANLDERRMRPIDADALIEILAEMQGRCATKAALIQNSKIWQQVKAMPTVDAEPVKHGRIEADGYTYTCSVCESRLFEHDLFWRYCPYCGARLDDTEDTGKNL